MHRRLLVLLTLLVASPAPAADDDARLWASTTGRLFLTQDWSAALMLQPRFSDDVGRLERFLIRPSIDRRLGDAWTLAVGYDAHLIREPRSRTEHRIWQQASFGHGLASLGISHRLRLEQRFIEDLDGAAVRLRQQLRATQPLFGSPWYAALSNEAFFNLHTRSRTLRGGFGENRAFAGVGYSAERGTRFELGYQNQWVERPGRADASNHTIVFAVSLAGNQP